MSKITRKSRNRKKEVSEQNNHGTTKIVTEKKEEREKIKTSSTVGLHTIRQSQAAVKQTQVDADLK